MPVDSGASLATGATEAGSKLALGAQESSAALGNQAYGTGGALYGEGANLATRAAEAGAGVTLEGQKAAGALGNQAYGTGGALYGEGTGQMVGAVEGAGQIALSGEDLRQKALTQGTTFDFLGNQAATDIYSEQAALESEALNRILQERAIKAGLESSLIQARAQKEGALFGAAGALGAGLLMSDVRAKTNIKPEKALDVFEKAPAYSYHYKDPNAPGMAPGRHFGPMAQDLERTPLGASAVKTDPNGMKMVDTGRLTMINSAALSNMARELKRLKSRVEKRAT